MNNATHDNTSGNQTTEEQNEHAVNGSALNSLSPIDDADKDGHYSKMLLWALKNRKKKDIKNIALTGPYGSGKSSIIKTFERKNSSDDLVFLNISLATFKEETGEVGSKIKPQKKTKSAEQNTDEKKGNKISSAEEKTAMLRLVELSILQQIFYHEKDEDIPDTRFKKARSFTDEYAEKITWNIFLFGASLLYIFYSKHIWALFQITPVKCVNIFFNVLAVVCTLWCSFVFIKRSIRPLGNIQFKKVTVKEAEFAMDESISKSVLNEHLDEILYFFEVTKYTVVVFEDLDRFEQTEIFTKLRELNHLINYSKKMNGRRVVFIYAVRDEMFQDKDRTKFFDFIVPVIPVINSSNSNEILREIVKKNDYDIKPDLLDSISFIVDDMRLLYNIMNEFYLYHQKLDKNLDDNILLGLLVYKNIYPNDFTKLNNNKGDLYDAIHKKDGYVTENTAKFRAEIEKINKEILQIESITVTNSDEVRKLYLLDYLKKYPRTIKFYINTRYYTLDEIIKEGPFELLINDSTDKYFIYESGSYETKSKLSVSFAEIEQNVDATTSYQDRIQRIKDAKNGKIEKLKSEIADIEDRIRTLKHKPIQSLLEQELVQLQFDDNAQSRLASVLLLGGYIDDSYQNYISIFYEGSLNRAEKDFILNVKARKKTEFDLQLYNFDKVIEKLPKPIFEHEFFLNLSLVQCIFGEPAHATLRSTVMTLLANESESSIKFIDAFISDDKHLPIFIKALARKWDNIWDYIHNHPTYSIEKKDEYLRLLIKYADINDLQTISKKSNLKNYIENKRDFLLIGADEEKLQLVIEKLKLNFEQLELKEVSPTMIDFVFENNYYKINEHMLRTWVQQKAKYVEDKFETQNYSFITQQDDYLKPLINYINDNLEFYLNNVWLNLKGDKKEDPDDYWYIIDNQKIPIELKRVVLEHNQIKFRSLSEFSMVADIRLIFETNMVEATWGNLMSFYIEENFVCQEFAAFINIPENAKALETQTLEYDEKDEDEVIFVRAFVKRFALCGNIEPRYYASLIKKMPDMLGELDFSGLDKKHVELLIPSLYMTPENYQSLLANYPDLHLKLLEHHPQDAMLHLEDFAISEHEVKYLLDSLIFDFEQKNQILHLLTESQIINDKSILIKAATIAALDDGLELSNDIILAALASNLKLAHKIALFNKYEYFIDQDIFFQLMTLFGEGFQDIKQNGKQAVIPNDSANWEFARVAYKRGYIHEPKPDKKGIRIRNKKE